MRYSCNDIFMVRTPSLPASVFSDFVQFEGNDVENFLQQTPFRDFMDKSILLSSRELYNAKKRNLQSSTKKSKARNLARIKFLIRACTRPTPYGLFAGAALGEFCENPNIEPLVIDERKAILECRADYSWLSHFIYEMENNPSVYPQLQLLCFWRPIKEPASLKSWFSYARRNRHRKNSHAKYAFDHLCETTGTDVHSLRFIKISHSK